MTRVESAPIDATYAAAQEREAQERREARTAFYGYDPSAVYSEA